MGQMIKFEHGMLVLNSLMTKEDVAAINEFADYVRNQENERIIKLLDEHLCVCSHQPHCLNDDHLHPADALAIVKG